MDRDIGRWRDRAVERRIEREIEKWIDRDREMD